jgi:uncharacterized membrane protein
MKTTEPSQRSKMENGTPYPDIPVIMESKASDYEDSGIISTVAIAGHPVHPVLVVFPTAFLVGAAGSDLAYWFTADAFWARASFWLITLGLISGVVAAVVGMSDFLQIKRVRKRGAGWAHMFSNVAALLATVFNLILRLGGNLEGSIVPLGAILSIIVALLLGVGGWFGGELAYRHKIASIGTSNRKQVD